MPSPRRKLSRPFRSGPSEAAPAPTAAPGEHAAPPEPAAAPPVEPAAPPESLPPSATPAPAPAGGELLDAHEPFLEPASEYELRPEVLLEPDGGGDVAFAQDLDSSVADFGASRPPSRSCEWCNTPLPEPAPATCPTCGAPLAPVEPDLEIPGLTTMSMEAAFARQRAEARRQGGGSSAGPSAAAPVGASPGAPAPAPGVSPELTLDEPTVEEAVKPPDDQVRRMMLQIELEQLRSSLPRGALAEGPPEAGEASDDEPA
jgi:hypothetical protein